MIHSIRNHLSPRRRGTHSMKKLLLLPAAGCVMALSSCSEAPPAAPKLPTVTVTDTGPVGDGLKVIGFAMLGAAVVVVLGRMLG